jgi:hypothetical protein
MDKQYPAATSGSRSKLISGNFKKIFSGPGLSHPQKNFTAQLYNAEQRSSVSLGSGDKTNTNAGVSDAATASREDVGATGLTVSSAEQHRGRAESAGTSK